MIEPAGKLKLITTFEGMDFPHRLMWVIVEENAKLARERYSKSEEGWSRPALVAMVFAFHAMEAYLIRTGGETAAMLRIGTDGLSSENAIRALDRASPARL